MAVTLEEITGFLDSLELKYEYDKDKEQILLINGDEDSTYVHFIRAQEDGDIFKWQMQILDENKDSLTVKEHENLDKLLTHMLYLNYNTKFGTWEYDPSDGDIRLAVEIPLEDATMTKKQFTRVASLMLKDADKHVDELLQVLKTGEFPQQDDLEILALLEDMLATLKATDTDSSEADGI